MRLYQNANIDNVEKYIHNVLQEIRDEILTYCSQNTYIIKSLYICTKNVQDSLTKVAQGLNLPSDILKHINNLCNYVHNVYYAISVP